MAVATAAGAHGPCTRADLEHASDDGRRCELIDGHLYVSAAPGLVHQRTVMSLLVKFHQACPADFRVPPAVCELGDDGAYHQVAKADGEEAFVAEVPFSVSVVPADLVR